jgi:hypothetical protein
MESSMENPVADWMRVLLKVLHDMELRRSLYYFTAPGMLMAGAGIYYINMTILYGPDCYCSKVCQK